MEMIWHTIPSALAVVLSLSLFGALWLSVRRGNLALRTATGVRWLVFATVAALAAVAVQAQSRLETIFLQSPALWGFALVTALGLMTIWFCLRVKLPRAAMAGLCLYVFGLIPIAAAAL